ncbi:MAG: hypothetical protein WD851_05220 [Pirellulales bacterium]
MHQEIHQLLSRVRRRIRLFILAETVLIVALVVGALFWVSLGADWLWEPSRQARLAAWCGVAAGLMLLLYRFAWLRLRRPLPNRSIALLVERAHPELSDRLLTSVAPVSAAESAVFLKFVDQGVTELARDYRSADVVSLRSLKSKLLLTTVLLGTIVAFAAWQAEAFGTWIDRLALSETLWPRRVHLTVEGFEPDEQGRLVRRIPRFESTEVVVHADLAGEFEAPAEVQIRYRTKGQELQRAFCARVGEAEKGRDPAQAYRHQFADLREPLILEIRGGDDRITNLHIEVLPRPRILSLQIDAVYPEYLRMAPRRLAAASVITVPTGTSLTIHGRASQPLRQLDASASIAGLSPLQIEIDAAKPEEFRVTIAALPAAGELSLLPIDSLGVAARESYLLTLVAEPDALPTATAQLVGIGAAITPEATIPLTIRAEDDHAVERLWVDLLIDAQPARTVSVEPVELAQPAVSAEVEVDLATASDSETDPIALQPGQRLSLVARAEDAWNLSADPRIGSSRTITLDVVTGDQLLESLEREEINLRRTFERVIEKTIQAREKLQSAPLGENQSIDDETRQAVRIRLARVVDDMQQITDETLSVAGGIQLIHDQLVNNRVGEEELKSRLRERIAQPLRSIAERELRPLTTAIDEAGQMPQLTARDTDMLSGRAQAVVTQMQLVLEEMKALETYSEVVAMLRKLIQEQETLTEKTRDDQRQQLRTLLED